MRESKKTSRRRIVWGAIGAPLACLMMAAPIIKAGAAEFVIQDKVVTDARTLIVDPEYDSSGFRMAHQSLDGDLWVAGIDPTTGAISPVDGKGTLVDSGLALLSSTFNGPEWAHGSDGTHTIYTKLVDNRLRLATAIEIAPGIWSGSLLDNGGNRYAPLGTLASNSGPAGIVYYVETLSGLVVQAHRLIGDSLSEKFINGPKTRGSRWGDAENTIVTTMLIGGVRQVAVVDTITGNITQVTTGQAQKSLPIMWFAPEYGDFLILARIGNSAAGVYQNTGSSWQRISIIALPSTRPFLHSPEPFVYQGKSYIVAVATDTIGGSDLFPLQPTGPTDIWIAGIDPLNPFFRQVSTTQDQQNRIDPEVIILEGGPAVYYSELRPGPGLAFIRRASTGL